MDCLHSSLPEKPGVYLFKDNNNKIIYVGKAKNLKKRVASYFHKKIYNLKTENLVDKINDIEYIIVNSEIEAFLLEANLIKKHKPFYNIKFSDDKYYPYIKISKTEIPYIVITRKKDDRAEYYGPYANIGALKTVLKLIRRIFPFQSVKNHPKRKCLYNHLRLCPCIPILPQNLSQYKKDIKSIEKFLSGKKEKVIKELSKERNKYAKEEKFEEAKKYQDRIKKINMITDPVFNPFHYEKEPNMYNIRIKKEVDSLIVILSKYFPEMKEMRRIECYDISNLMGKNAVGSMVVFINGEESKKDYRKFKIMSKSTPDDFLMIREVLSRRLKHVEWNFPDLIIIDGGKGQVSIAYDILLAKKLTLPLIGIAKKEEIIVIPRMDKNKIVFYEERLPRSTPGINLIRRIRDEAHRFAINYHRILRKKTFNLF